MWHVIVKWTVSKVSEQTAALFLRLPWRWRQCIPPKHWYLLTNPYGLLEVVIVTAAMFYRAANIATWVRLCQCKQQLRSGRLSHHSSICSVFRCSVAGVRVSRSSLLFKPLRFSSFPLNHARDKVYWLWLSLRIISFFSRFKWEHV